MVTSLVGPSPGCSDTRVPVSNTVAADTGAARKGAGTVGKIWPGLQCL